MLPVRGVRVAAPKSLVTCGGIIALTYPVEFTVIVGQGSPLAGVSETVLGVVGAIGLCTEGAGGPGCSIIVVKIAAERIAAAVVRADFLKAEPRHTEAVLRIHPRHRCFLCACWCGWSGGGRLGTGGEKEGSKKEQGNEFLFHIGTLLFFF